MVPRTIVAFLLACVLFALAECAARQKRGGDYGGGGYGGGYGNLYGPYYDKFDQYNGIPGFHVYSKYGSGDNSYGKAVFASEHGYGGGYGGGGHGGY